MHRYIVCLMLALSLGPLEGASKVTDFRAAGTRALDELGKNLAALEKSNTAYQSAANELAELSAKLNAAAVEPPVASGEIDRHTAKKPPVEPNAAFAARSKTLRGIMEAEAQRMEKLLRAARANHHVAMSSIRNIKA